MYKNIIFVGGVHGAGKSSICNEIIQKTDFLHIIASDIIRTTSEEIKSKIVRNISKNQSLLLEGLKKVINSQKKYILDGHFCLRNKQNLIEKLPLTVFKQISPIGLILIKSNATSIVKRLQKRDNLQYNNDFINNWQRIELEHAKYISESLNIYLEIFENDNNKFDYDKLKKKIVSL